MNGITEIERVAGHTTWPAMLKSFSGVIHP